MKILQDIRAIAYPSQIFALLPFYTRNDEDNFRLGKWGRWYGRLVALIILISSLIFAEDVLFASKEYRLVARAQGDTEEINRTIETLLCILSYTMMVLSSVQNSSRHCRTLQDIAKIDEFLVVSGFCENYSCRKLGILVTSAAFGVLSVAFYYIHYRSGIGSKKKIILLLIYSLQLLYSTILSIYLRSILMALSQRIAFLNQRLDSLGLQDNGNLDNWRELCNLIEVLCKFRYITENMNSVAGVALLFYFGFSFYTVTNQSYLAFATLTANISSSKTDVANTIGLSCAWVLAETITMAVICDACDCLASETNSTAQILARIYGKSKQFQNLIDKFLTKSIKQELQFTAYGFFAIDNSTLFKIFSAVTTYLVILIQFKQLEDSKVDEINQT
ncbi:gustatory receptor 68a [Drosophila ficusphila]|uniref:gustatory receptor 68a n=1 Tax=Drosophila ficusphila TaxID=30025 RepID=UPI0007E81279|nr:gustatory receptor 68a [Drosophila ficusphila]